MKASCTPARGCRPPQQRWLGRRRALSNFAENLQRLEVCDRLHFPLLCPGGDDRLGLFVVERAAVEQDVSASAGPLGHQVEHAAIGKPAVFGARGVRKKELAEVE